MGEEGVCVWGGAQRAHIDSKSTWPKTGPRSTSTGKGGRAAAKDAWGIQI